MQKFEFENNEGEWVGFLVETDEIPEQEFFGFEAITERPFGKLYYFWQMEPTLRYFRNEFANKLSSLPIQITDHHLDKIVSEVRKYFIEMGPKVFQAAQAKLLHEALVFAGQKISLVYQADNEQQEIPFVNRNLTKEVREEFERKFRREEHKRIGIPEPGRPKGSTSTKQEKRSKQNSHAVRDKVLTFWRREHEPEQITAKLVAKSMGVSDRTIRTWVWKETSLRWRDFVVQSIAKETK